MKIYTIPILMLSLSSCYALDIIPEKTGNLRRLLADATRCLTEMDAAVQVAREETTRVREEAARTARLAQRTEPSPYSSPPYSSVGTAGTYSPYPATAVPVPTPAYGYGGSGFGYATASPPFVSKPSADSEYRIVKARYAKNSWGSSVSVMLCLSSREPLSDHDAATVDNLLDSNKNYFQKVERLQRSEESARSELVGIREEKRRLEGVVTERDRLSEDLRLLNDRRGELERQISDLTATLSQKDVSLRALETQFQESRDTALVLQRTMEAQTRSFEEAKAENLRYISELQNQKADQESECGSLRSSQAALQASLAAEKRKYEDFSRSVEGAKSQVQRQLDNAFKAVRDKKAEMEYMLMTHKAELKEKDADLQARMEEIMCQSQGQLEEIVAQHGTAVQALSQYKRSVMSILFETSGVPSSVIDRIRGLS